ncbi:MAG: type IV pili twitching motility protein PilT [Omnitrophica bacterium RIFCSPHIGHO2_02_FULL_49_9]|nr:MAG: type IV pili twitching motility protein PilT [Omnitrophica bacterium RIFCSPHIGHO2_02_FULL_49_9]OGW88826.1 MAG: type IV pili twitching motility protein PilT [Omnitrophica bacterium RIFCSPLOWO2_01_FULL_50_24]
MDTSRILAEAVKQKASDIHIAVGRPVTYRVNGRMVMIDQTLVTPKDTEEYMRSITSEVHRAQLDRMGGVDFGFDLEQGVRFRVSCFKQRGVYGLVLRLLPKEFFTFETIGLSDKVIDLLSRPRGLILVTGPTGSGKSSTLAAMVNYINEKYDRHIITIEDPIEYRHEHKKSIVTQREVGTDVPSFSEAVIKSLRQDPDVLLIGEMRDLPTMEAAITAAETGHLVFATLHTTGAARTVDRVIDVFPAHQQPQIRTQLASTLIAVISQALLPKMDGSGRIAALEVLILTPAVANLIREGKTHQIISELQTGAKYGSHSLDSKLVDLYSRGVVSYDEALAKSYDPGLFIQMATQRDPSAKGGSKKPGLFVGR